MIWSSSLRRWTVVGLAVVGVITSLGTVLDALTSVWWASVPAALLYAVAIWRYLTHLGDQEPPLGGWRALLAKLLIVIIVLCCTLGVISVLFYLALLAADYWWAWTPALVVLLVLIAMYYWPEKPKAPPDTKPP